MQCENDTLHAYMYYSDTFSDARASRSCDYSMPASLRPSDTGGVFVDRCQPVSEIIMAWKKQTESEKVKKRTDEWEKYTVHCGDRLEYQKQC